MNESTPLVSRAHVVDDDVENPTSTSDLRAVERDARETRNRVRNPVYVAIAWTMLFVVMATYFHSDGFEKVRASTRTVKGVRVYDDDFERLRAATACKEAFTAPRRETSSGARVSDSFTQSSGLDRIYERMKRDADGCESSAETAGKTLCVNATEVLACADRAGVVLPTESIRDRYLLATVIKHAKDNDVSRMAFLDGRAEVEGALDVNDRRALGVLINSDEWNTVRLQYDSTLAVARTKNQKRHFGRFCPHNCRCKFQEGKLCKLRSSECELSEDAFFVLRHDAYDDVLATLPHATNGSSFLKSVAPQWIVVPPFTSTRRDADGTVASKAPQLGLPLSCVEKASVAAEFAAELSQPEDASELFADATA
jgi:hypothetical protein